MPPQNFIEITQLRCFYPQQKKSHSLKFKLEVLKTITLYNTDVSLYNFTFILVKPKDVSRQKVEKCSLLPCVHDRYSIVPINRL